MWKTSNLKRKDNRISHEEEIPSENKVPKKKFCKNGFKSDTAVGGGGLVFSK